MDIMSRCRWGNRPWDTGYWAEVVHQQDLLKSVEYQFISGIFEHKVQPRSIIQFWLDRGVFCYWSSYYLKHYHLLFVSYVPMARYQHQLSWTRDAKRHIELLPTVHKHVLTPTINTSKDATETEKKSKQTDLFSKKAFFGLIRPRRCQYWRDTQRDLGRISQHWGAMLSSL